MKKVLCLASCAALALSSIAGAVPDLTPAVTSAQIVTGAGVGAAAPRLLCANSAGNLILANQTATSNADFRIVSIDISGTPAFTVLANKADLDGAITTAGGVAPASVSVRGMVVTSNGNVILATDDTSIGSYLFRITAAHTVQLLSGLQTPNTVDGANGMGVLGNTVYIFCNDSFAVAPQNTDHIQAFDTTLTANGTQPGTELVSQASLISAIPGSAAGTIVLNTSVPLNASTLLFLNSGSGGSDEILTLTSAGVVTLAKSRASILSNLGDSEIGFGAAAYHPGNNIVYLANAFGTANVGADDDILQVTSAGTGTASVYVTDAALEADSDYPGGGTTQFSTNNHGVVAIGNFLYATEFVTGAIWKIALPATEVAGWEVYN